MALDFDVFMLILRVAFLLLLALFLFRVVSIAHRDLKVTATAQPQGQSGAIGHLVVIDPGHTDLLVGAKVPLEPISSLGRRMTNHVPLNDDFVSGEHALLTRRGGKWWLEDLHSTNGTFVNGQPIGAPVALSYGDVIEIGRVKLRLSR